MSTLKVGTISNTAGTLSISADRVAQGTAAAWVNFNGTGTVAIRASFNVSSITDNGTGDYTVNFASAMPDANYSAALSSYQNSAAQYCVTNANTTISTTQLRVQNANLAAALVDNASMFVAIFR